MNTEKEIKSIQVNLDRLYSELNGVRAMVMKLSQQPDSSSSELPNNYSHLLPEGYEFCDEGEAEKVVKVLMMPSLPEHKQRPLGGVVVPNKDIDMEHYRPIRKTPTPSYQVDWSNAPDWADVHCFDEDDKGYWYGAIHDKGRIGIWEKVNMISPFTLPDGLDWKLSKTTRPC